MKNDLEWTAVCRVRRSLEVITIAAGSHVRSDLSCCKASASTKRRVVHQRRVAVSKVQLLVSHTQELGHSLKIKVIWTVRRCIMHEGAALYFGGKYRYPDQALHIYIYTSVK